MLWLRREVVARELYAQALADPRTRKPDIMTTSGNWLGFAFLRASSCEAIAAVNRPVTTRIERDFGHAAAFAACCREHLPFWTIARGVFAATGSVALRLARFTTIRAAPGILCEALLGVEVLLRSRERELSIAVAARHGPISGNHVFSSLVSRGDTRCRFEAFQ